MRLLYTIRRVDKLLLVIILTGFILRVVGINFGLPSYFLNSDENEYVVAAESAILGTPSPYKTGLPINIFYYILTAFYYLFHFISVEHLAPGFFIIGRLLSVILSTASIHFVYLIGKNLVNKKAGIFAALTLAVIPVDVHIAHYIKEDVYIQFFGILSLYFLSCLQKNRKSIYAFLAVFAAILAGSAKLNGFFYIIPLFLYLLFLNENAQFNLRHIFRLNIYKLGICTLFAVSIFVYFLSTPISFMDSDPLKKYSLAALINPEHEVTTMSSNADGIPNYLWWPVYLLSFGTGYITSLLIICSLGYVSKKKLQDLWPYLLFIVLYTSALLIQTQRFDRWITMVTPLFALCLGCFIYELRHKKVIVVLFGIGFVTNLLVSSILSLQFARKDTRSDMVDYIVRNIPKDEIIYFQEVLDPPKHYLNSLGYVVYDYSCRDGRPQIDLAQQGSIYVVVNQTFSDITARFAGSEMKAAVFDCATYVSQNGVVEASFRNSILDTNLFGFKPFVGPATARYLHSPNVKLIKTNAASEKFEFAYTADFAYKYGKNLTLDATTNVLRSEKGKQATLNGPHIPIPAGHYEAIVDFTLPDYKTSTAQNVLLFGVKVSSLENPIVIEIKNQAANKRIEFKIDRSSKIEFDVIFTGETQVILNKIRLKQI